MQIHPTKRILLVFLALLLLLLLGCSSRDENAVYFGKLSDAPLEGVCYLTADGKALSLSADAKALSLSVDGNQREVILNDFQNGKRSTVGTIPNVYLSQNLTACVNETVYFFQTIVVENRPKNVLFAVDLKQNTLKEIGERDAAISSLYPFGENRLVTRGTVQSDDDLVQSRIDCYDCAAGSWTQLIASEPGTVFSAVYADKDYLYLIASESDAASETLSAAKLVQYDAAMNPVNSWVLEGESLDALREYSIAQLFVRDGFLYLKNVSGCGYLGRLEADGTIRPIEQREQWLMANSANPGEETFTLFFDRGGSAIERLDYKTGKLEKIALTGGLEIVDLWIHADRVFIHSLNRAENNSTAVYGTYQAVLEQFAEKTE